MPAQPAPATPSAPAAAPQPEPPVTPATPSTPATPESAPSSPPPHSAWQEIQLFLTTQWRLISLLSVLVILVIIAVAIFYRTSFTNPISFQNFQKNSQSSPTQSLVATTSNPTATKPPKPMHLAPGKQTYHISHGHDVTGPKPTKVIIDPIDPNPDQTQTITVSITSDSPVTKATAKLHTDNLETIKTFKLIEGTDTNGTWQTTAKINDSYLYRYYLGFNLQSDTGAYTGGLTFRQ